jgi:soluble lytic murein transglycosylase-like protein
MSWKDGGEAYLPTIAALEVKYGIPTDLLARVAFQECSWRGEVINGAVRSGAGAVGMFQLMPSFFPGAGESWQKDADTAGEYLAQLHTRFKDWQLAVAAYNWGPTALQYYLDTQHSSQLLPRETSAYVARVFADVPVQGVLV